MIEEFENELTNPKAISSDEEYTDYLLRPKTLKDYIGQVKLKENLSIFIESAIKRNCCLDHVLLYGPPGLGKTTLASIIAHEMNANIHITSGSAINVPSDLAAILIKLKENDILYIDEIHRMSKEAEELLYTAMQDFSVDIIMGKGLSANSIRIDLEKFTLVGATTRAGQITLPLRDRFGIIQRMELYNTEQLMDIVMRSSEILGINCDKDGVREIGKRSRGTPRIANRLLKRVRDFAYVIGDGKITGELAVTALNRMEIDPVGLNSIDRLLLNTLIMCFDGGPVGLDTLAATISEEAVTIEDVCEPFLIHSGFLMRSNQGRCATKLAYDYLGIEYEEH